MTEDVKVAAKTAAPKGITLSQEDYDALVRKAASSSASSISRDDLEKALKEHNSLYGAAKALGKSYAAVKNAVSKYGIEYTPVPRSTNGPKRTVKSYTLSEDEKVIVGSIVFALKNRPQLFDAIKALADKCTQM